MRVEESLPQGGQYAARRHVGRTRHDDYEVLRSAAFSSGAGNFCLSWSTGLKMSPAFFTRCKTSAVSNDSRFGSPAFNAFATSSHSSGVETVGCSFARSE